MERTAFRAMSTPASFGSQEPADLGRPSMTEDRSYFFETAADRPMQSVEAGDLFDSDLFSSAQDAMNDTQISVATNAKRATRSCSAYDDPQDEEEQDKQEDDLTQDTYCRATGPEVMSATLTSRGSQTQYAFFKSFDAVGNPKITISQAVSSAALTYPKAQDNRQLTKTIRRRFKDKAVLGALVGLLPQHAPHEPPLKPRILKLATSQPDSCATDQTSPAIYLSKPIWRERVKHLAKQVNLRIGSYHDASGVKGANKRPENVGKYHASHVEKKLSVFALYMMLEDAGIQTGEFATVAQIRRLRERQHALPEPERLRFEVLVSRRWCGLCRSFVRRLSAVSGLDIVMRVQPMYDAVDGAIEPSRVVNDGIDITAVEVEEEEEDAWLSGHDGDVFQPWELADAIGPDKDSRPVLQRREKPQGRWGKIDALPIDIPGHEDPAYIAARRHDETARPSPHADLASWKTGTPAMTGPAAAAAAADAMDVDAMDVDDTVPVEELPPPTLEKVEEFRNRLSGFAHDPSRKPRYPAAVTLREPLFKKKPLPPTPVHRAPSSIGPPTHSDPSACRANTANEVSTAGAHPVVKESPPSARKAGRRVDWFFSHLERERYPSVRPSSNVG